jgi:hypothetical protein
MKYSSYSSPLALINLHISSLYPARYLVPSYNQQQQQQTSSSSVVTHNTQWHGHGRRGDDKIDPAKVTFTPTIQYLPFRLAGVVQCYIKANPPLQYVTWTKDKRLLEPYQTKDIVIMNNGSLLFTRVNQNHQVSIISTFEGFFCRIQKEPLKSKHTHTLGDESTRRP